MRTRPLGEGAGITAEASSSRAVMAERARRCGEEGGEGDGLRAVGLDRTVGERGEFRVLNARVVRAIGLKINGGEKGKAG